MEKSGRITWFQWRAATILSALVLLVIKLFIQPGPVWSWYVIWGLFGMVAGWGLAYPLNRVIAKIDEKVGPADED